MRDIEAHPYSADEKRVAEFFFEAGLGGGDDPIGFIIASHQALAAERNSLQARLDAAKAILRAIFDPTLPDRSLRTAVDQFIKASMPPWAP